MTNFQYYWRKLFGEKTRKLKASYSLDSSGNLRDAYGFDKVNELSEIMSKELNKESK